MCIRDRLCTLSVCREGASIVVIGQSLSAGLTEQLYNPQCFLQYEIPTAPPPTWNVWSQIHVHVHEHIMIMTHSMRPEWNDKNLMTLICISGQPYIWGQPGSCGPCVVYVWCQSMYLEQYKQSFLQPRDSKCLEFHEFEGQLHLTRSRKHQWAWLLYSDNGSGSQHLTAR